MITIPKRRTEIKVDQYQKRIWIERSTTLKLTVSGYLRYLDYTFGHMAIEVMNGGEVVCFPKEISCQLFASLKKINESESEEKFNTTQELVHFLVKKHLNSETRKIAEGTFVDPSVKKALKKRGLI